MNKKKKIYWMDINLYYLYNLLFVYFIFLYIS